MVEPLPADAIQAAEVVLPCAETDLEPTLAFFTGRLGFRVAAVFPADSPRVAVVVGHGLRVRLEPEAEGTPGTLRLLCADPAALAASAAPLVAPNGTRVELVPWRAPIEPPPLRPAFVLTRAGPAPAFGAGRAGMLYRDLMPGRQGGRFVASEILVPEGGPVPDYVHYHRVRFQLIYCRAGWVRVVYQDQGPPFVLQAGDAVLQPPEIRHRVLECSPGLRVIEVASPAEHETLAELELELPTPALRPERDFSGQRFTRHEAGRAAYAPAGDGFEARDLGIAAATSGLAGGRVLRHTGRASSEVTTSVLAAHDGELLFRYVLAGSATLHAKGRAAEPLSPGDAFVVPAGLAHALRAASADLELLEIALPAR